MAILGFELEEIARLIALVDAKGLEELIIEEGGRGLRIRGPRRPETPRAPESAAQAAQPAPIPERIERSRPKAAIAPPVPPSKGLPDDQIALVSPMVGVFFRAERPGAPPLVQVGDRIEVDQTIGIIEAMKVFSEFKADHAGAVIAIPAQDGQLVQTGAPLFILKRDP